MPLHDYQCTNCAEIMTNELRKPEECPHCRSNAVTRLFPSSPPAAKLTGTGFYETDYKYTKTNKPISNG